MHPRLLVNSGSLCGTTRTLVNDVLRIGSDAENHLQLTDPTVSGRHCTLQRKQGRYELIDLDSHNGTFVNGIPIHHKFIEHGDSIHIGQSELIFLLHDEQSANARLISDCAASALHTKRLDPSATPSLGVEVGRMARDLVALFQIANVINSFRESALLQQELLRIIFEVVPAETGAVILFEDLNDPPSSICTHDRKLGTNHPINVERELIHRAIWERSAISADIAQGSSSTAKVLCLPLIAVEKVLGVIYLICPPVSSALSEDHIHFLDSVSRIAAVTLENIHTLDALRSENRLLKEVLQTRTLIGESRAIKQVEEFVSRVAPGNSTVLIRGESGTGKEVVARAIHYSGPNPDHPFVAINCAAIPETLLESELFGHEKGAFTGAIGTRKGKFELAGEGTLFLDEIGELPPSMQVKLLRVLQQREFERIGATQSTPFKARIIAATNKNLEQAIKSSEFRQDLYYRLNVVSITTPPLRDHREDIPLLALYFATRHAEKSKRAFKGISPKARTLIMNYSWPGNVRELENAIEHAIVLGLTDEILPEDLPASILEEQSSGLTEARYHDALNQAKREMVLNALRETKGSYPEAARLLNIHPKYLHRLAKNLHLKSGPN
jgi:transcriptional regulator with GAF, ATPase, and Fis domain